MYNEDVSIDFSANVAPFSASLSQAVKSLENMSASADTAVAKIGKLDNIALGVVKTFGKWLDLNKASTVQAAAYQQKLAGLATVAALNEKQFGGLSKVALGFARDFPIGLDKSIDLINTLHTSGVTTTKSIKELGSAFVKIQASTGEWGSGLVSDMLSVNRSFGSSMGSVVKFGDSLVSVSNKFGASASSVAGFTKALAPVASAMGLNQTQTLGFSTAFARLGEDGTRSANALSKVMSDLTSSAKTGSPQIQQYAAAMNMSADSLKELVDSNPAEAVVKFTEVISKQGPKAIDTLNRLGIDGVQTFKSLQALGKSKDIREILQTSADSYGSGSANKGAKEALGGVNDQMTRLGETMQQTVASAGTPFLEMIAGLLKAANAFANAIHSAVDSVSNLAHKFAPLLAALKLLHSSFQAIMLLRFGQFLANSFQNSPAGRSFALGRADASYGLREEGGNRMYNMGQRFQNNFGGIMGRPIRETMGNIFSGAKGAVGYGLAGIMNLNTSMLRGDASEVAPRQLISRNFAENIRSTRIGGDVMSASERKAEERINKQRVARGLDPLPKATGPAVGFIDQMKGIGQAFKQFGADLKDSGKGARLLGVTAGTAGGELRVAFAALTGATFRATGALIMMALQGIGKMLASMGAAVVPMIAMMAAFQAFNSIKEGTSKAHQLRDEGIKAGLETPGSVYNDFAQKAGLATRNVDSLAKAAQAAAHQLVVNTKTLAEANNITEERMNAVQNPAYKQAWTFGKNKNAQELANEIINLEGKNPNAQARAQLINDLIKQYGAGTAQQVVNVLAPTGADRSTNVERKRTSADVYSAGFNDIEGKRENKWWSSTYRGLLGLEAIGGTILTGGLKYHALENGLVVNNGQGHYDTQESKDAMSSLITNIASQSMNNAQVYGDKAGQLSKLAEAYTAVNVGKNQGHYGDAAAVVNALYGTNYKGVDIKDSKDLIDLLKKTLPKGNDDQKALYESMFGKGGYAVGQNFNNPNFMKVMLATAAQTAMESADRADKKITPTSKGLTGVVYGAQIAARRTGFTIDQLSADSSNEQARKEYMNAGKKGSKLSLTDRIAIDASNRPNDPVAQQLQSTSIAIRAMNNHSQDSVAAMKELTGALHKVADGSVEQAQILNAFNQAQGIQQVYDAGLGTMTKARRDIAIGEEAQKGEAPKNEAEKAIYDQKIKAMQEGYAAEIAMVKQFAEARNQLNIQITRQNEQYHKQVMRSNRDFNIQMLQQQQDYQTSVRRANEDFQIQRKRQSEDLARTIYNPFQRITANRTADASGLLGNLKQQNKVIKEQMSNVAKLKKMGLSQQAIDTLDLFNPANAQEVARLVLDYSQNKNLIEQTNAETKTRNQLTAQHESSQLNYNTVRQEQDFNRRMTIAEKDYNKAVTRAKAAHARALSDMRIDLRDTQNYAYQDLTRFGSEIDVTASNIKTVLEGAFAGLPKAAKDNMSTALKNLASDVKNWKGPTIHLNSDYSLPRMGDFSKKTGRPPRPPQYDTLTWNGKMSADSYYQDPEYTDYFWQLDTNHNWNLNRGPVKKSDLKDHIGNFEHAYVYNKDKGYVRLQGYADGGLITGPGTKTSDSIPAMVSQGEYVIKADAVDRYGVNLLDGINNMNFRSANYVSGLESKVSSMQPYSSSITNNTSTQYDQSTQIHGPITVQASDPNEFMRKVNAKKRFQRLSNPAGV